jgi:hypothetical protein
MPPYIAGQTIYLVFFLARETRKIKSWLSSVLAHRNYYLSLIFIIDIKKAGFMVFSNKKIKDDLTFKFGEINLPKLTSIKYLGIIFDSKLTFAEQIKKVKKTGNFTIHQLSRIDKCSYGLSIKSAKN